MGESSNPAHIPSKSRLCKAKHPQDPPFISRSSLTFGRNVAIRTYLLQSAALVLTIFLLSWMLGNAIANLSNLGINNNFSFLWQTAPFNLAFTPFWDYKLGHSKYWEVFVIGVQNTLLISLLTILSSTILGSTIGILRLSPNWVFAKLASTYIEIFRNIPLLLQLMFWHFAIFLPLLPHPRHSLSFFDTLFLHNGGLSAPKVGFEDGTFFGVLLILLLGLASLLLLAKKALGTNKFSDRKRTLVLLVISTLVILMAIGSYWLAKKSFSLEIPHFARFGFKGSWDVPLSLFSLWFSLTVYTSAFIAENVRSGILSVDKGQTEAAYTLGLGQLFTLQKIIIPQALRTIIPPTISQYLNATKNSSLAIAVAYEDITNIWSGIALNQTGQTLIIISMTIAVYLTLSLITSGIANYYNSRVRFFGR